MFARFSTVAGERGAADAERDIRGFAMKFYTEKGNWDLVGNNTPVFFLRDPLKFPDLNHAIKRDPRTNMRSAKNNWDFWTSLPEALHRVTITMSDRGIPLSINGAADHWNLREDDNDYYAQPGLLFKLISPQEQKVLFENTARAMGDAPKEVKIRHMGNCMKADPAYGKEVAAALGIPLSELG